MFFRITIRSSFFMFAYRFLLACIILWWLYWFISPSQLIIDRKSLLLGSGLLGLAVGLSAVFIYYI